MSNLAVDVWQTFDFTTLSDANLEANDNASVTWDNENAAGKLSMSASGERKLPGTINTTLNDASGTNGLAYDCSGTFNAGYVKGWTPSAQNDVSVGFWWKFPAGFIGSFSEHDILTLPTNLGGKQCYIKAADQHNGTGEGMRVHIFNPTDSYSTGIVVAADTWYWVTVDYSNDVANGMKLRIYDAFGAQVGVEESLSTGPDGGILSVVVGSFTGGTTTFTGTMYFDDLVFDWTTPPYPLGPGKEVLLSGTASPSITEADVVAGGKTIILTVDGDKWVPASSTNIQYVGGQVGSFAGKTGTTTVTFALTGGLASAPAAGDIVIVSYSVGSTADRALTIQNASAVNYTLIGSELYQNDTFDSNLRSAYRFMPTPTETTMVLSGTGSTADAGAYTIHVFRGVDSGTPMDVAAVTAGNINTRIPNPGSITPTTSGAWLYVVGGAAGGTGGTFAASYLTDFRAATQVDTNDAMIGAGYRVWTSGAYDPAAFTGGGTDTVNDSWNAITAALRPVITTPFADARAAIRDNIDSAQAEAGGWDAKVKPNIPLGNIVRTSDAVCTVTLQAQSDYDITATETITATAPSTALVGAASEAATPTFTVTSGATATRGLVSFAEFETPSVATRGRVSFAELEVPTVGTRGLVSWAEFEVPLAPTRGLVSWSELETPNAPATPTRGLVSWGELETPNAPTPTRGLVSWSELEAPTVAARGLVSWMELETPTVGGDDDDYYCSNTGLSAMTGGGNICQPEWRNWEGFRYERV